MNNGFLDLSPWATVAYTLILTHITIAAVTIFLHRHQAHRTLTLNPVVSHFFRFWLWLTTGMITREWVAVHRKHHAKCESDEDPHSPQVLGLRKVLWRGAELYRREASREETREQYGKGAPDDWIERHLYTPYNFVGIVLMLVINLALLGPVGVAVWAVQMVWIPFWAAGVINGVGHYVGYRKFQSPDASTNIVPWGIVIGGEELHNNHHAFPNSARFSSRWWEFDLGWFYIRLLSLLGLARIKRVAPRPAKLVPGEGNIDAEAVRAVINARYQVLAGYGRDVLKRVYREELRRRKSDRSLKARFRQARSLLLREERLLDEGSQRTLQQVFEESQALKTAYQFRKRLQSIWQSAAGPDQVRTALQEWCRQAEATGIEALQRFARQLGGYRLRDA
ncbi:DesA family fatty acid desaturase [Thiohalomonas denitrificans]|uniref:DesA family fatty acid desaturase n=1 Tax=Thiohalomonas denitrificans TaxID=415747 RepID=UPI0026EC995D|nr:fatty acid desaturase [Thiohalomonas denitrificans]